MSSDRETKDFAADSSELSDNEWCAERAKLYDVSQYVRNGQSEQFTAIRLQDGLVEGRRRNAAEAEARYPELTTLIPKMAEGEQCWLGHGASIALCRFIAHREEVAAREVLGILYDDVYMIGGQSESEWVDSYVEFWKNRKNTEGL